MKVKSQRFIIRRILDRKVYEEHCGQRKWGGGSCKIEEIVGGVVRVLQLEKGGGSKKWCQSARARMGVIVFVCVSEGGREVM